VRKFLIGLLLINTVCQAEETSDILKRSLKDLLLFKEKTLKEGSLSLNQCLTDIDQVTDPKILAFVSFSIPDVILLALAQEIKQADGVLIFRGLPNNSFKEFAQHILKLKERGFSAEIQINPKLFDEYNITAVPSFVIPREQCFDKIAGNISLEYALEVLNKKSEIESSSI
jgi:conjugal transfer pilus assembly protein TrbC